MPGGRKGANSWWGAGAGEPVVGFCAGPGGAGCEAFDCGGWGVGATGRAESVRAETRSDMS